MNSRADAVPDDFAAALAATIIERGMFGARLFYFTETGSTNDLAAVAADRGEAEGTTFVAGTQTAGRGRLGRVWFSPPGAGLYMSTIVRRRSIAPWITLAGGVAVAEGIRSATGLPVEIKWPNDVVTFRGGRPAGRSFSEGRKKIAGILAEASSSPAGVDRVILGIGINLRSAASTGGRRSRDGDRSRVGTPCGRRPRARTGARASERRAVGSRACRTAHALYTLVGARALSDG